MLQVSQRHKDKKRQNRRQIAWTLSLATIIVLGMTWYDLKLRDYSYVHRGPGAPHFLQASSNLAALPDDYSSLTIWQARLETAADGAVTVTRDGVTPQPFPQRQVDLVFEVPRLPDASVEAPLQAEIVKIVAEWEADNNMVTDLVLDVREMDAPPGRALLGFIQRLREKMDMGFRVSLLIDPLKSNGAIMHEDKDTRFDVLSALGGLYMYLPETAVAESFAAIETLESPYNVIIPDGRSESDAPDDTHGQYKYFQKFITHFPAATPAKDMTP